MSIVSLLLVSLVPVDPLFPLKDVKILVIAMRLEMLYKANLREE